LQAGNPLEAPPYTGLRARLDDCARDLRDRGQPEAAARLEALVSAWWAEQSEWDGRLMEMLRVHHDINNALVGVSGNAQLLMRDPVAAQAGVRERLEVMLREAGRIQAAAARLREAKYALAGGRGDARAA